MARPRLFKLNARARSTVWGIALCTMFIVASFTIASGLRDSATVLKQSFSEDYYLVTLPADSHLGSFEVSALQEMSSKLAVGLFAEVTIDPGNALVGAFMIQDPNKVLPVTVPIMNGSSVLVGPDVPVDAGHYNISLNGVPAVDTGGYWSPMFSPDWILGSEALLRQIEGSQSGFNFAIAHALTPSEESSLQSRGFQVHRMVGIIEFLDFSVKEAGSDSYWIIVPSSFAIAVLAYGFVGSETADRRHDIGIVKTIGAGRRSIFGSIMSNAFLTSVMGGLLGLALGIIVSYGLATIASNIFSAVLVIRISEWLLVIAFAASVVSATIGAVFPAIRMTVTSPNADLREAPP